MKAEGCWAVLFTATTRPEESKKALLQWEAEHAHIAYATQRGGHLAGVLPMRPKEGVYEHADEEVGVRLEVT